MKQPEDLPSFIIACHKKDLFLTKICAASIRYFYPSAKVYLIKDFKNGSFSTRRLEKYLNVKIITLGSSIFGWGNAKLVALTNTDLPDKKFIYLDSDTALIGPIFDRLSDLIKISDILVSPEYHLKPGNKEFENIYYEIDKVKKEFPGYFYPGFTFNSGQFIFTRGVIKKSYLLPYFNSKDYPYWKKIPLFSKPLDQPLLNIVVTKLARQKKIRLRKKVFMIWSESKKANVDHISLEDVKKGKKPYIIHWAGALKNVNVEKMTRGDILSFFEKKYYSNFPLGLLFYYLKKLKRLLLYQN